MKTTPSYWGSPEADAAAERICDRREIAAATATLITIQLPTEPSYWGTATPADVDRILDNLESMIRAEFEDRYDLIFERTATPQGSGVHPDDGSDGEEIHSWIQNNWGAAL